MITLTKFLLLLFLVQEREVFIRDLEGIKTSILIKLITNFPVNLYMNP